MIYMVYILRLARFPLRDYIGCLGFSARRLCARTSVWHVHVCVCDAYMCGTPRTTKTDTTGTLSNHLSLSFSIFAYLSVSRAYYAITHVRRRDGRRESDRRGNTDGERTKDIDREKVKRAKRNGHVYTHVYGKRKRERKEKERKRGGEEKEQEERETRIVRKTGRGLGWGEGEGLGLSEIRVRIERTVWTVPRSPLH